MSLSPFFDWRRVTSGDNGGDRLAEAVAAIGERNTAVLLIIGLSCLWSLRFSESKLPQNEVTEIVGNVLLVADSRRCERDYSITQKEIVDLQKQVTIIIKECRDVQLRCGSVGNDYADYSTTFPVVELNADSDVENVISGRLVAMPILVFISYADFSPFSECMTSVTGLNNNEYEIARGQVLNLNTGLDKTCNFVKDAHQWVPLGEVGACEMTVAAREGCRQLQVKNHEDLISLSKILLSIADALEENERLIATENEADVAAAHLAGYEHSLIARLTLKPGKARLCLANSIRVLANMEEPIGRVLKKTKIADRFILEKTSSPLGVLLIIFQSCPEALVQVNWACKFLDEVEVELIINT
ncbi:hypothetical protein ACSBR2_029251 [Camellia fascicularis]